MLALVGFAIFFGMKETIDGVYGNIGKISNISKTYVPHKTIDQLGKDYLYVDLLKDKEGKYPFQFEFKIPGLMAEIDRIDLCKAFTKKKDAKNMEF